MMPLFMRKMPLKIFFDYADALLMMPRALPLPRLMLSLLRRLLMLPLLSAIIALISLITLRRC